MVWEPPLLAAWARAPWFPRGGGVFLSAPRALWPCWEWFWAVAVAFWCLCGVVHPQLAVVLLLVQRGKPRARLVLCSGASGGAASVFFKIFLFCQIPHLREQGLDFSSLSPRRGCARRHGSMPRAASVLGNPNCSWPQARRGNIWVVCRIVCLTAANSSRAEAPQLPAPFARVWLGLRRGADPPGTGVAPCPRGRGCFGVLPGTEDVLGCPRPWPCRRRSLCHRGLVPPGPAGPQLFPLRGARVHCVRPEPSVKPNVYACLCSDLTSWPACTKPASPPRLQLPRGLGKGLRGAEFRGLLPFLLM